MDAGILQHPAMGKSIPKPQRRRTYIKEWREQRGWSQEDLAAMVGVTQETISRLEAGKIGYVQGTLEQLADALHCTVGELTDHNPTKDGLVVQLARMVPADKRQQVIDILNTFVKKAG